MTLPLKDFLLDIAGFRNQYIKHVELNWNQTDDWIVVTKTFPRGTFLTHKDYAENGTLDPKLQHQSKYFSTTQYTLFMLTCTFHIEDLKPGFFLKAGDKQRLLVYDRKIHKRPVVNVTVGVV